MAKQTSSKSSESTAKKKRPSEAPAPITKTILKADAATPAQSEPVEVVRDVVIRSEPSHDQIAQRAFELFQTSGHREGNQLADWLKAEQELRG